MMSMRILAAFSVAAALTAGCSSGASGDASSTAPATTQLTTPTTTAPDRSYWSGIISTAQRNGDFDVPYTLTVPKVSLADLQPPTFSVDPDFDVVVFTSAGVTGIPEGDFVDVTNAGGIPPYVSDVLVLWPATEAQIAALADTADFTVRGCLVDMTAYGAGSGLAVSSKCHIEPNSDINRAVLPSSIDAVDPAALAAELTIDPAAEPVIVIDYRGSFQNDVRCYVVLSVDSAPTFNPDCSTPPAFS